MGVDADGMWRALLMVAKEPEQFNCEFDTVDLYICSLRRTVNTHLNEVRTEAVTVDGSRRKIKFKNVKSGRDREERATVRPDENNPGRGHMPLGVLIPSER